MRKAASDDLEEIASIARQCLTEVMAKYHSPRVIVKFLEHQSVEEYRNQLCWKEVYVALKGDRIAGTGALANFGTAQKPFNSLSNCYVHPDLLRRGIGTLIVQTLIELASQRDPHILHCPSSRNGIKFYEHFGFTVDEIQNDADDEITWMSLYLKQGR